MDSSRLVEHIRKNSTLLEPVNTGVDPRTELAPGVFAVVFDVYGTLMISGSGDISLAQTEDRSPAIREALATAGYHIVKPEAAWSEAFLAQLDQFSLERKRAGVRYPEVRIEEVWEAFIRKSIANGWMSGNGDIELAIVDHECRVNPCWPMPGLDETLKWLTGKGLKLGIVSNAQFYTPLLFEVFLNESHLSCGFVDGLSVWSYREREGKPSTSLYQILKDKLEEEGILPEDALYIGNDMRNDIWPAQSLGFRTALFAGDARSLRWRKDDPACRDLRPDFVITDLHQLSEIIC